MLLPNAHSFRPALKTKVKKHVPSAVADVVSETPAPVDSGKRSFLRLAGLLGLGVVASQVLPKKAEAYVLGGSQTGVVGIRNHLNARIDSMQEDGGNLDVIAGNVPAQGQADMSASMPVTIASNQSIISAKVTDGSGNVITSTSSALDLNIRSGSSEVSYTENSFTNSASGRLMMGRYGTEINAIQTDAQGNLKVDDSSMDIQSINGEFIPTTSPGVLPTTLVDMGGNPIDTFAGSLQVKVSNPLDLCSASQELVITRTGQGVGQFLIKPTDVSGYAIGYLQVNGVFTATYVFEGSNNIFKSTWASIPVKNLTLGTVVISNTVAGQYQIPFSYKYFRIRISAFTSGLPQATLRLSSLPIPTNNITLGSVAAGADGITASVTSPNILPATGSGAPLQLMAHYNNGTTYDTSDEIVDGTNFATGGTKAVGLVAQLSDVPIVRSGASLNVPVGTIITEKRFGDVRMSKDRSLNVDVISASGNGLGVDLSALSEVPVQNTAQVETLKQILDATNALHDDLLAVQPLAVPLTDKYSRYVGVLGTTAKNIGTANVTVAGSTSETTLVTGIPGKYCHIRSIVIANTDTTNSSRIDLRDETSGPVIHQWQVPAKSTQYIDGGKAIFLPQTGAGNNWTITCGTATSNILVSTTYEIA